MRFVNYVPRTSLFRLCLHCVSLGKEHRKLFILANLLALNSYPVFLWFCLVFALEHFRISQGTTIPLIHSEAMLFPSTHWKLAPDNRSNFGSMLELLLHEVIKQHRFASAQQHIFTRLKYLA